MRFARVRLFDLTLKVTVVEDVGALDDLVLTSQPFLLKVIVPFVVEQIDLILLGARRGFFF